MDGERKERKAPLFVYIQPSCVSVVAFVFFIEFSFFLLGSKGASTYPFSLFMVK